MIRLIPIVVLLVIILAILVRRRRPRLPLVEIRSPKDEAEIRPVLKEGQNVADLPSGAGENISEADR